MPALTDECLMAKFRDGEDAAFGPLYDRYKDKLYRFVAAFCVRDARLAEDRLQEIFLRVVKARGQYDPERKFSAWLYAIARNVCRDHYKGFVQQAKLFVLGQDELVESAGQRPHAVEDRELGELVRAAVDALPEDAKAVFELREVEGLSHQEIAATLGISEANAKTTLCRAKKQLRQSLQPHWDKGA